MGRKNIGYTAEKITNGFSIYGEVYLTIQTNTFLYYMSRLPVLNRMIRDSWYRHYRLKKIWALFSLAFGFARTALANNIGTLVTLYVFPNLFLKEEEVTPGVFLMLFLLLKCLSGALMECGLFKTTAEDYTFLNHFMVNPVTYYRYKALKNAFFSSVMLFPVLFFLFRDWGMVAVMILLKLFCVLCGNVVYLHFYRKYGRLPGRRARRLVSFPLILLTYTGAFLGLYENIVFGPAAQTAVAAVSFAFAAFCWRYHLQYSDYKKIAVKFANQSAVTFQITVQSSSVGEEENGLLESGWEENRDFFKAHGEETSERYLDLAFFSRFGRALRKERRSKVLVMLLIGVILGFGIRFGWLPVTPDTVLDYSPVLIAFVTSMTFASRLLQVYFRNIDLHMLYHHIATPEFIRSSMLRRYLYLLKGDLLTAVGMVVNLLLMLFVAGLSLPADTVVKLAAVCIAFLLFWETYEFIVYYIVQPYSVDMTAKSPVFKALGYLESLFYLLVLFVRRDLTAALPWVCAAAGASVLVFFVSRKIAPRTFRLR